MACKPVSTRNYLYHKRNVFQAISRSLDAWHFNGAYAMVTLTHCSLANSYNSHFSPGSMRLVSSISKCKKVCLPWEVQNERCAIWCAVSIVYNECRTISMTHITYQKKENDQALRNGCHEKPHRTHRVWCADRERHEILHRVHRVTKHRTVSGNNYRTT